MMGAAALLCVMSSLEAVVGSYVMTDSTIRTAVAAWLSDSASAEAAYGHISTWETSGVTDMSYLFCARLWSTNCNTAAASFNEDIGAWDTSGVTTMYGMFYYALAFNQDIGGWATHNVKDMSWMFLRASAFDQDISDWAVQSVTDMGAMFEYAYAFNQDLGWCVDDGVSLWNAFSGTQCEATSCGVINNMATLQCGGTMDDTTIRTAVRAWLSDSAAAEATYGHISTWKTGGVKDMSWLFSADWARGNSAHAHWSFNEPIGGWDVRKVTSMSHMFADAKSFNQDISGWQVSKVEKMKRMFLRASSFNKNIGSWSIEAVTSMNDMFRDASAFDQDLGWCVGKDTDLDLAFEKSKCESTSCGVAQKDVIGLCEWIPVARPCLIGPDEDHHTECFVNSPTLIIAIVLMFLALGLGGCLRCGCFCCRKKTEPSSVNSRPDSPAESPSEDSDEEATAPESLETRAAAKAEAAETAERPGLARKLSSFLFGEQEEEPTALAVAEAEEAPSAEQPPARRTEPEPAAKSEEMYTQIAAWYNEPENAMLRTRWGAYPNPDEFQSWPGFVAVTNAFLDREAG
jgi:surface protein